MRILLTIHSNLDPNTGAPGVTLQLAAELRRRGHIVTLASFDDLPTRLDLRAKSLMFPLLVARRLAGRRLDAFDVVDASMRRRVMPGCGRSADRPGATAVRCLSRGLTVSSTAAGDLEQQRVRARGTAPGWGSTRLVLPLAVPLRLARTAADGAVRARRGAPGFQQRAWPGSGLGRPRVSEGDRVRRQLGADATADRGLLRSRLDGRASAGRGRLLRASSGARGLLPCCRRGHQPQEPRGRPRRPPNARA